VHQLDDELWQHNTLDPAKVQLAQLCCSDFLGNPAEFAAMLDHPDFRRPAATAETPPLRLGYIGVPTIVNDLYSRLAAYNARLVFHEVQRQFLMPHGSSLAEAYTLYTYPYGIFYRLADIRQQIKQRRIDGVIHYVQSFCYRGIEDMIVRREIDVPVLTLQGDLPSCVTGTMEIRIEAFLDMLRRRHRARHE
jgi:benzoyl-CoA reductase/2-hydroxyglutaryl-CoA dehydratase subunit BcrC/BadD/HgdB